MNNLFSTDYSKSRSRKFLVIAIVIALIVLIVVIIGKASGPKQVHVTKQSKGATTSQAPNKSLVASHLRFSCDQYQSVFGPNYNNQLFLNWATWTSVASSNPNFFNQQSDIFVSPNQNPYVKYQYNASSAQSYNLYVQAMNNNGCQAQTGPPERLLPATALNYSFIPNTSINNTTACNQSFIYQTFTNFSQQFHANEKQEVSAIQQWLNSQGPSDGNVTATIRQGVITIQNQHNDQIKTSVQALNTALSQAACSFF